LPLRRRECYASGVRTFAVIVVLALTLARGARGGSAHESATLAPPIGPQNHQLLLVRSATWFAASGTLERYERTVEGHWTLAAPAVPVSLGRNGMGWGRGLHAQPQSGPFKREGDGRSPAGAYALSRAFGAAETLPAGAHEFPYLHALSSSYCVEDLRSKFYNQIIDANDIKRTAWERWSELRRADGLFDWAVIVRQNEPDVQRGSGSCVFLHVWRGPHNPTAGCTAMPHEQIEAIVRWLDPHAEPILVQLPDPALKKLREAWGLP
jgi:L,D-peptidoglycan transpeptidase YkuD (ErfK/YbiS/YcfS/YnhG family)